ncbi:hypothetical protein [Kitasatospora sp. CB01950]|uniref:hypothetical protein n=1 Tax=Kitasatospora sp. CB01950 TaxID=1703930 RepID=UPI000940033A|nr:hypothetical protein [Kitasatospora sp. CB01950]OKJ06632.1 hypothetical protein AMK19_22285 [Kitasatospora sp. CB01950]
MPTPADRLEAARSSGDPDVLRALVAVGLPFVDQALAENPRTPQDAPAALAAAPRGRCTAWNDNRLLRLLAEHPSADAPVLDVVLAAVAEQLAAGQRPYAAVIALAARVEVPAGRVRALGESAGASARVRGRVARVLAGRR